MEINYRLGLDIGIASVGWAVLENGMNDEPIRIADLGVRIFERAEIAKSGESLAAPRRNARTSRRRLRRRKHRLDRIKFLLQNQDIITVDDLVKLYDSRGLPDVYQLRVDALDRKLTNNELAQVLLFLVKHRGFKSTRKAESKEAEGGKVLEATKKNMELYEQGMYRTVGEMIYKDASFKKDAPWRKEGYVLSPRNKQDDYKNTILRDLLVEEIKKIFQAQRQFGNEKASKLFEEKYLDIFCSQRSFDKGPGKQVNGRPSPYAGDLIEKMVGLCTFEKEEKRAPKASYTSERFVLLQKVNNIRVVDKNGEIRGLEGNERELIIQLAYTQKEVKYSAIRKKLNLSYENYFKELNYGYAKTEKEMETIEKKAKFISLSFTREMNKIFSKDSKVYLEENEASLYDKIGNIITLYKSDETRVEKLKDIYITEEQIQKILELNPSKFQHLSFVAMKKIIPYLEQGMTYNEACDRAGYSFRAENNGETLKYLKGKEINDIINNIPNPGVKRSISQTIKVINAIIRKYGSPQAVHIELAREMAKNFQERNKIEAEMKKNQSNNDMIKKQIMEYTKSPTGQDILKFKLWKDQNELCMYSGEHISIEELFEKSETDIDHIIPYSICFDDSYKNKVLVKTKYNREKGNRLPYEYFGQDENRWEKYEILVNTYIKDFRKRALLLKRSFTKEEREAFKERNLTDTKYITRVVYNMIRNYLQLSQYMDSKKKKKVFAVNGSITSYMRKRWGLSQKDRSTDIHHAVDAVIVACCTDGMINRISRNVQARELYFSKHGQVVDEETGEVFERKDFTREEWDEKFGVKIPLPWYYFKKELDIRMSPNPKYFEKELLKMGYFSEDIQNIKPIFVSRMPHHKVTGAGHEDTIRSPRHFEEKGIVLTKTPLTSLTIDKKTGEIEGYYCPSSDRLLYEALKERLNMFDGKGEKAFAEPFYKPKADGTQGPLVKKVKIYKKQTLGVYLNDKKGITENGPMIRIDVFRENKKYYFVPIYTSDTKKKELPNKAAVARKAYSDWKEMKEENFLFSLYSRDVIKVKHKKGIKAKTSDGNTVEINDCMVYFLSANISTASIKCQAHDSSFEFEGLGVQSLEYIKKYEVSVLGDEIREVKTERRRKFNE